ncbi:AFG2-interacting ribosome maturation factor isoform X2 [Petromyzon marinus]|uniref:AFG2-interacting ribosome maturation factor isoform X2 n=1 Tax=Petromyzon marinus TaxID=7757 RepID=UPI003F7133BC
MPGRCPLSSPHTSSPLVVSRSPPRSSRPPRRALCASSRRSTSLSASATVAPEVTLLRTRERQRSSALVNWTLAELRAGSGRRRPAQVDSGAVDCHRGGDLARRRTQPGGASLVRTRPEGRRGNIGGGIMKCGRSRATPESSPSLPPRAPLAGAEASLRRALAVARRDSRAWDAAVASCEAPLASLANRAEQLRCLRDVDLDATPLRDFPDLGPRLGYKIAQAMEELLARVEEQMFVKRRLLLQRVGEQDLGYIQGLPQAWARLSSKRDSDFIHDVLLNVSFFLDEN